MTNLFAMQRPIDVPTQHTVQFIAAHASLGATVIEVGCGSGEVTMELKKRGYDAIGVDEDADAVARALELGAPAVHASWTVFKGHSAAAIVFARSLHHMKHLREAVRKARHLLLPSGKLLLEDFAFDEANSATIEWFCEAVRSRMAGDLIAPASDTLIADLLACRDPWATWRLSHDHELHSAVAMTNVISECFTIESIESVPYLYRYLVPVLPETDEATRFVEEIFEEESRLGALGELTLVGRRVVASRQSGNE